MKPTATLWCVLVLGGAALAGSISSAAAEKFPASWRKTMTNDPATNFYLAKYTGDLQNPLQTAARNFFIARIVGAHCQGAKVAKPKLMKYLASVGMDDASKSERSAAYDAARTTFNQFDYRALAHVCAGVEYMFGPSGKLVAGIGIPGKGEPRNTYDSNNPYIRVETLIPRQ